MNAQSLLKHAQEKSQLCYQYMETPDRWNYHYSPESSSDKQRKKETLNKHLLNIVNECLQSINNGQCTWYNNYTIVKTGANDIALNPIYVDQQLNINYQTCRKLNELFKHHGFLLLDNPKCQFDNDGIGGPSWIEDVLLKVIDPTDT